MSDPDILLLKNTNTSNRPNTSPNNGPNNTTKKNGRNIIEVNSHATKMQKNKGTEFYLNNIMEKSKENDDNIFNEILNSITIKDICALFGLNAFNKDVQNNLKIMIPKIIQLYNKYVIATDPEGLLYFLTPLTFYVMSNYYIYKNIATDTDIPNIDHYKIVEPIMNNMRKKFLKKTGESFAQITGGGKMKGGATNLFTKCLTVAAAIGGMVLQGGSYVASGIADIGSGTAIAVATGTLITGYVAAIPSSTNALGGKHSQSQRIASIVEGAITSGFAQGWGAEMLKPANAGNLAGAAAKYTVSSLSDPVKRQEIIRFKTAELMQGFYGERFVHEQLSQSVGSEALGQITSNVTAGVQNTIQMISKGVTTYAEPVVNAAAQTGRELAQTGRELAKTASQYAQTGIQTLSTAAESVSKTAGNIYTYVTTPEVNHIQLTYDTVKQSHYFIVHIVNNVETIMPMPIEFMPTNIDVGYFKSAAIINTKLNEKENSSTILANSKTYDFDHKIPFGIGYYTDSIKIIYRVNKNNSTSHEDAILMAETYDIPYIPEESPEVSPIVLASSASSSASSSESALPAISTLQSAATALSTPSASPVATPTAASISPAAKSAISISTAGKPAISISTAGKPAISISTAAKPAISISPSVAAKINPEVFVKTHVDPNLYKTMQYIEWLKNNELIDLSEKSADRERLTDHIFTKDGTLNPNAVKDIKTRLINENRSDTGTTIFGSKKTTHNNATKKITHLESFNPEDTNALIPLSPSGNMYTLLLHTLPHNKKTKDVVINKILTKETLSTNSLLTSINAKSEKLKELFPVSNPTEAFIQLFNPSYHMYKTSANITTEKQALQEKASKEQEQRAYAELSPANQIIQPLTTKSSTNSKTLISYYTNIINWAAPTQVFLNEYFSPIRLFDLKNSNSLTIIQYLLYIFSIGASASITKLRRKKISESVATAVIINSILSTALETVINLAEEQHAYDIKIAQTLLIQGFKAGSQMGNFFAKNNIEWTKWGINAGFNLITSMATKFLMPLAIPLLRLPEGFGLALQAKLGQLEGKTCEQSRDEILRYISDNNGQRKTATTINTVKDRYQQMSNNRNCISMEQQSIITEYITPAQTTALGGAACLSGGKRRRHKTKKAPKYKKRKMTRRR